MTKLKEAPYNLFISSEETPDEISDYNDDKDVPSDDEGRKMLKDLGFKFPNKKSFRERMIRVYGYDIEDYRGDVMVLYGGKTFPEIIKKNSRYIYLENPYSEVETMYLYNNFVMYEDKDSFYKLMNNNQTIYLLEDLVNIHGYVGNQLLVEHFLSTGVFNGWGWNAPSLVYSDNHTKGYYIRKDLVDTIFAINGKDDDCYNGLDKAIQQLESDKADGYLKRSDYLNPDSIVAYLYEKTLSVGITKYIENRLDREYEYKYFLESQGFFNLELIKEYVYFGYQKKIYLNSPDGYSNLREKPNAQSEILATVSNDEYLRYLDEDITGDWIKVHYINSSCVEFAGYIHKSQIK